jgi:hypothetical protein
MVCVDPCRSTIGAKRIVGLNAALIFEATTTSVIKT